MSWKIEYLPKARRALRKLDSRHRNMIMRWLDTYIDGCENPRAYGRALVGDKSGFWRYRVGKYRVICELHDDGLVVLAVKVGHRSDVYR